MQDLGQKSPHDSAPGAKKLATAYSLSWAYSLLEELKANNVGYYIP